MAVHMLVKKVACCCSDAIKESAGLPPGARLVAWLAGQNNRPRIAVVHQFSTHNLLLRYWLALTGVDPDRDIETVVGKR